MWPNPLETADLVTLTEEILNGKLIFFCSDLLGRKLNVKVDSNLTLIMIDERHFSSCLLPDKQTGVQYWKANHTSRNWSFLFKLTFPGFLPVLAIIILTRLSKLLKLQKYQKIMIFAPKWHYEHNYTKNRFS